MPNPNRIRRLPPGAPIPNEEPRVYTTSDGYRVWRWRVGPRSYLEALEHRIIDGRVTTAVNVHHRNHDRSDNRPENLVELTPKEHRLAHSGIDYAAAWERYSEGFSTTEVGEEFGINAATLSRRFRDLGYQLRSVGEGERSVSRRGLDEGRVVELHMAGLPAPRIAADLGTTPTIVRAIIRERGLPRRPVGRPAL
jgi:hypothetical protein